MATRLVLHIGMHKTGSTAIQRFLSRNRAALRFFGVLYPPSYGADGARQSKHNALFTAISHEADFGTPHPVLGPSADLVAAMGERIARSRASVAVLSAEGFSGERPVFAKALAPLAERFETKVVVFLRRPDLWVERFYMQMVMSREIRETRDFDAFLNARETRAHLDYPTLVGWWQAAFGEQAVQALPYDEARRESLSGFIRAASLPQGLRYLPHIRARANLSPPKAEVEAMRGENALAAGFSVNIEPGETYLTEARRARIEAFAAPSFALFDALT